MMKKKVLAMFLVCIMVLMAACSAHNEQQTEQQSEQQATAQSNEDLEEFDIVLDWYPNAIHSFIYVAMEKGYYEEEGLHVNVRFPANTNDALSLTAAGRADMGIYYLHDTIMTVANENIPVKSVGALVQSPLNIILSLKEKNISSPKDLIGKKVGQSGSAISEGMIKSNMEYVGATENANVELIDVGFDLMSSMTTGKVDATIGCMVNHEVPQMEAEGFEIQYYYPNEYGVPNYYELVLLAGNDTLQNNKQKIQKFLRASIKGFEYTKEHKEEALQILLDNQNEENFPLKKEVEQKSMDMLLTVMETENTPFLSQNADVWQNNIDWLKKEGLIQNSIMPEDVFENIN